MMELTADKALEILKEAAEAAKRLAKLVPKYIDVGDDLNQITAALAFFDGKHVYVSRFKCGDLAWHLERVRYEAGPHRLVIRDARIASIQYFPGLMYNDFIMDEDCFPTREEAQAECDRRNKEAK